MPAGRPKIKIDPQKIRELAQRQWTTKQIAAFFGVHVDTVRDNYSTVIEEAKHQGIGKLYDKLWTGVDRGSEKLLIHALNRFDGPVEQKVVVDTKKLTMDGKVGVFRELLTDLENSDIHKEE